MRQTDLEEENSELRSEVASRFDMIGGSPPMRELFEQNGRSVTEVKLITDRDTGRPRGFGFVEMASSDDADGAVRDLNGTDYGGRALTVNEARERTERF